MKTDRGAFLAALGVLLVAPAVPKPVLAAAPKLVTLEDYFYATLGPIKDVVFVARPGIGRLWTVSLAYVFRSGEHEYSIAVDHDDVTVFNTPGLMADVLRQDAQMLGQHARKSIETMGNPVLNDMSKELKLLETAWWREPALWPNQLRGIV